MNMPGESTGEIDEAGRVEGLVTRFTLRIKSSLKVRPLCFSVRVRRTRHIPQTDSHSVVYPLNT